MAYNLKFNYHIFYTYHLQSPGHDDVQVEDRIIESSSYLNSKERIEELRDWLHEDLIKSWKMKGKTITPPVFTSAAVLIGYRDINTQTTYAYAPDGTVLSGG